MFAHMTDFRRSVCSILSDAEIKASVRFQGRCLSVVTKEPEKAAKVLRKTRMFRVVNQQGRLFIYDRM